MVGTQEDWESDVAESPMPSPFEPAEERETKEEREERERREFIEAMRRYVAMFFGFGLFFQLLVNLSRHASTVEAEQPAEMDVEKPEAQKADAGLGRIFGGEGDMIEEHEIAEREKSALEVIEVCDWLAKRVVYDDATHSSS